MSGQPQRGLLPLVLQTAEVRRDEWTLPPDLKKMAPLLQGPHAPHPGWSAKYVFGHRGGYDELQARGCAAEMGGAFMKGLLPMTGLVLSAAVQSDSKVSSTQCVADRLALLPVEQQVKPGTEFRLHMVATGLTEVCSHDLRLPAGWTVFPFEQVVLMVLHAGEFVDITVTAVEGTVGYGPHQLAASVGAETMQLLPPARVLPGDGPHTAGDRRRALAVTHAIIVRFRTPPQVRPEGLMARVLRDLVKYLRDLEKLQVVTIGEGTFDVVLPSGAGSFGAGLVIARAVLVQDPLVDYVAPGANGQRHIRIRGKSPVDCHDRVVRAAKALAKVVEDISQQFHAGALAEP